MGSGVRFGTYEFDPERRELRKHGLHVRVPAQSLEILAALVERPGETVTRERVRGLLWPHGTVVGFEQSINTAVKRLREALGDPADNPRYIERVPRMGYRFIAPTQPLPASFAIERTCGKLIQHYRLLEQIGAGSRGEVWKAEDTNLGRTVALKFLSQHLEGDEEALESFRQEACHAAALCHPNICTIYSLEEHGGQRFLVMEYIEGNPLSGVLNGTPLPVSRALEIGVQAALALAAAHSKGVIHRDVKPANLMLSSGDRIKLTDFGIAMAVRAQGVPPGEGAQTPAGTLGYLSPEQARGDAVDARSDLFSLGAVLYEMTTGIRPFRGDTPTAILGALLHMEPASPRGVNPRLPRDFGRAIVKALQKDPCARWQTADEMADALQRIARMSGSGIRRRSVIAGASVAAAAVIGRFWPRPPAGLAERDQIVVADFENQTGDAVFDGALRQATLSQLGQSRHLNIVSEERIRSVLALMSRASHNRLARGLAREVCQRAGAKAVLAGSVGLLESRYFIGLEAIGCVSGESLANEYEEAESRSGVLTALSKAVSRIRGQLGESLSSIERSGALAEATTPSIEALQAYSMALHERAIGNDPSALLDRAIRLDPTFAAAHFTQAQVCQTRGQEAAAEEAISKAYALRERASERERLAIEGLYHNLVSGDAPRVIAVGGLASRLYPRDATVWGSSVLAYCKMNEFEKALEMARRQIEVAPDDGISYVNAAVVLIILGRTAESRKMLDQAGARGVAADLFPFVRCVLAALEGDPGKIEREAELARGRPFEHRVLMLQAQAAGYFGRLAKARAIARQSAERGMSSAPAIAASVALNEAVFGLEDEARDRAKAAIRLDDGRRTGAMCALTFALTNEIGAAESILTDLLRRYPRDTLLTAVWPPALRGAIALSRGDIPGAIRLAEAPPHTARFAWPPFIRGSAYLKLRRGAEAAAAFREIIERKNVQFTSVYTYGAAFAYPVVQLNLARALAIDGQVDASRRTYEEVLAGWTQADQEIPVVKQARAEHSALITSAARLEVS